MWGLFAGCSKNEPNPADIVARVGDKYLLREVVMQLVPDNLMLEQKQHYIKQIVEQWVDSHTLATAALKEGFTLTPIDQWQIDKLESELLANRYIKNKMRKDIPITDQEIEDYYHANQEQFRRTKDEVHLIHLYMEQLDNVIRKEIQKSKDLLEVIKNNYLDTQISRAAEPNGDLGYLPVEQLRREFQNAIRGTRTGVIYGPIKTKNGYHFLQVIDRQPAGSIRSLDLVDGEIRAILAAVKQRENLSKLKAELRKKFEAETFYENIL
jgi:parvulin-like peptidyl-prolyl isomerase